MIFQNGAFWRHYETLKNHLIYQNVGKKKWIATNPVRINASKEYFRFDCWKKYKGTITRFYIISSSNGPKVETWILEIHKVEQDISSFYVNIFGIFDDFSKYWQKMRMRNVQHALKPFFSRFQIPKNAISGTQSVTK